MSTTDLTLGHIGPDDPDHPEFKDRGGRQEKDNKERRNIVLTVAAPNDPDPKHFRFDVKALVGDAAKEAAATFDYDPDGTPSFRLSDGTILDRSVTLKVAGLQHRDEVELVDIGGGV